MAKKFPLGRVRELAAHVAGLHEHLQGILADCDNTAEDDTVGAGSIKNTTGKPAQDDSDAGEPWAGQDSARVADRNRPLSLSEAIPGLNRLARSKSVRP
jgi:hypothetical protein